MHEIFADFMKLDEWPGLPDQSVPLAPITERPELAPLENQIVTLISFDLQAQGRIVQHNGWWFAILTSAVEDIPASVASS